MFRVNTTRRNVKRAPSPFRPATDVSGTTVFAMPAIVAPPAPRVPAPSFSVASASLERCVSSLLEAESASALMTKPWLRLERGLRLQKYRIFTDAFPGLSSEERVTLYEFLVKANDARLLNTKTVIQYEDGKIISIKGLKIIRTGDPAVPAVFKIEAGRQTKRNTSPDAET
jgi:hypothetical protein